MNFLDRVKSTFATTSATDSGEPETDGGNPTQLFDCRDCNSTYISTSMETCPECGGELEVVPNEKELGIV